MNFLQELVKQTEERFEFHLSGREGFMEKDVSQEILCLKIVEKYTRLNISTEYEVDQHLEDKMVKSIPDLCDKLREFVLEYEEKKEEGKGKGLIKTGWEVRK